MFRRDLIAAAVALAFAGAGAGAGRRAREDARGNPATEGRLRAAHAGAGEAAGRGGGQGGQGGAKRGERQKATASGRNRPDRSGENAFNPAVSLILQGTYANDIAGPQHLPDHRFRAFGRGGGAAQARLRPGRNRARHRRQYRPLFPRRRDCVAHARGRGRGRGGVLPDAGAAGAALSLKGGRFFSGIGYLNEQHQHAWDFQDAPLVYKAFLGDQLKQDGVQLKWIAPTPIFSRARRGTPRRRPVSRQRPQQERHRRQRAVRPPRRRHRAEHRLARGAFLPAATRPITAPTTDVDSLGGAVTNSFHRQRQDCGSPTRSSSGRRTATPLLHNFKLQGEYFRLKQNGNADLRRRRRAATCSASVTGSFNTDQSGWYAQGVWQFMPRWRVGYRYDTLSYGTVEQRHRQRRARADRRRFPGARQLQPDAQHADVRLEPERVQPTAAAVRVGQVAHGPDRQPDSSCSTSTAWARTARTSSESGIRTQECEHESKSLKS